MASNLMNCVITKRKPFHCLSVLRALAHVDVNASSETRGPLHGITICDMTRVLAGPFCTMVLGDMGAEIIKIERPDVGDDTRRWGPPFIKGESCYNLSINRNKKSVCVDIQTEAGKEIIYKLVKKSDIFLENFIPGKLDSLGFGYTKLSTINPSLIYCSINGYGSRGIDKNKPGYDLVATAVGGLLHITGPPGGPPCRPGVAAIDILTGLYAHSAIISAIYERSFTKVGKKIDVSLLQTQVATLSLHAVNYLNNGVEAKSLGSSHCCVVPSKMFKTKDGELVISAADDETFKNLCSAIGYHELYLDDRFITNPKRVENRGCLENIISECIQLKDSEYWLEKFNKAGVPCGPINDMCEAFASPEVAALNNVHNIAHPRCGDVKVVGPAVAYDGEMFPAPPLHPPLLDEHTEEVLSKL